MPAHRRLRRSATLLLAVAVLAGGAVGEARGQQSLDGIRLGVALGGTGFLSVAFEFFSDDRAVELTLATWGFQDAGVSLAVKELFGAAAFRPSAGVGLWFVWSEPDPADPDATRPGMTLLARAPVGFDWRVAGGHYLDGHLNLSRGLWIRRSVPGDDRPTNPRLVPFPGLAWRWKP